MNATGEKGATQEEEEEKRGKGATYSFPLGWVCIAGLVLARFPYVLAQLTSRTPGFCNAVWE